jgi:hypothetical protein
MLLRRSYPNIKPKQSPKSDYGYLVGEPHPIAFPFSLSPLDRPLMRALVQTHNCFVRNNAAFPSPG